MIENTHDLVALLMQRCKFDMKQKAILIVDDVELNRAILCELFRNRYKVLEAEDGLEALRIIREKKDDLAIVLLDIVMPVMDGFGVLEAMKAEHIIDRLPVILITVESSETVVLRGYELGVSDVINKPFSPSVVYRRVENVIELYRYHFRLERIVTQQKSALDRQARKLDRISVSGRLQSGSAGSEEALEYAQEENHISRRVLWLLELEREKYRLLSEMSGDIVFNYDRAEDSIEFTENFRKTFEGETKRRSFRSCLQNSEKIPPEDRELLIRKLDACTPENTSYSVQIRIRTARGREEWFEIFIQALWNKESGACAGYIGKIINIDDMKAEADRWREEAYRDPLTSLYNRKGVEELSPGLLEPDPKGDCKTVLFFVDIDNFKQLNDCVGHLYGDEILKYVGREMQRHFRNTDIVGRIGGDEFIVLMRSSLSPEGIRLKANELCNIFRDAPRHELLSQPISGSVGIACSPKDGDGFRDLLHKADLALYQAKNEGKNRYAFYEDALP